MPSLVFNREFLCFHVQFYPFPCTIQEFTICLNISIIHLTEKLKFIQKPFIKNKWYVKRNKLLDENGKLRTYLKLKCNFGFENYLHILSDFNQRKSFTKFRISNHKLKIETGWYSKPITPLENRICEKCFSDENTTEIESGVDRF